MSFPKMCNVCERKWETLSDFTNDPDVKMIGRMLNLLWFDHSCGTTLVLRVKLLSKFETERIIRRKAGVIYLDGKNFTLNRKEAA